MSIKKGSTIFETIPLVQCLNFDKKGTFCDYCFKKPSNLLRCSKCKFMHYCNPKCQQSDWTVHKTECSKFSQNQKFEILFKEDLLRFFLRVLIRTKINNEKILTDNYTLKTFNNLTDHYDELVKDTERMKRLNVFKTLISDLMGNDFMSKFTEKELATSFGKTVINKFVIKSNNEEIGLGLYLSPSSLDHSCEPNCSVEFNGSSIVIKAIKDIGPNDKQFISYCDTTLSYEQRNEFLTKNFYFECKCNSCTLNKIDVDFEIYLPCGFTACYKDLVNKPESIDCVACKTHKLNIKECLDMPKNRLSLSQKTFEFYLTKLEKLRPNNVEAYIDDEFDRLKSIVDLRREELKKQIDDYYFEILDKIEHRRCVKHSELKQKPSVKIETKPPQDYQNKLKFYEKNLNLVLNDLSLYEKLDGFNQSNQEVYALKYTENNLKMENVFGKIALSEKYLSKNLAFELKQTFVGHSNFINFAKFISKDKIISSSNHGEVKLWSKSTGECIKTFDMGRHDPVLMVVDDKHFLADQGELLKIWNIETFSCVKTIRRNNQGIYSAKVLRNGDLILSTGIGLELWDLKAGKLINSKITNAPLCFEETPEGSILGGSRDLLVRHWERDLELDISFNGHTDIILSIKCINEDLFVSGSKDRTIRLWSIESGKIVRVLEGHEDKVMILDLIDSSYLLSGCNKGFIKLWSLHDYKCLTTVRTKNVRFTQLNETKNELIQVVDENKIEVLTNNLLI